jgi:hypothetical protein
MPTWLVRSGARLSGKCRYTVDFFARLGLVRPSLYKLYQGHSVVYKSHRALEDLCTLLYKLGRLCTEWFPETKSSEKGKHVGTGTLRIQI